MRETAAAERTQQPAVVHPAALVLGLREEGLLHQLILRVQHLGGHQPRVVAARGARAAAHCKRQSAKERPQAWAVCKPPPVAQSCHAV